ncbi:EamA family transporter [Candidatus Falkowbacteria bacterium]|jgi:drug/metabolite transporter (DMT)-like permease|nr:EamA family transporter [Candidatus Falkowbacteria bacterium]MBT4432943.1 EamA family transporter [Candidatus Falkowbacteria bacterium]
MSWIYIVVIAYLLNAIAITIDKFLLTKSIPNPAAYTFNIGMLNILIVLALLPFGFFILPLSLIFLSIIAGLCFMSALYLMYTSLKHYEASRIAPYIGSLNPIFIFILAYLFLGEKLMPNQISAFFLIIAGGILISIQIKNRKNIFPNLLFNRLYRFFGKKEKISLVRILSIATLSAFFFASSYALTKYIYNSTEFLNGFIWTRFGLILGALLLLVPKNVRNNIFKTQKKSTKKTGVIFLVGQIFGGLSFFLINYSFSLNSVTLVHALQGLQYAFLFLIVITLSKKFPQILEEKLTPLILTQKIIALGLIGGGLYLLVV